LTRAYYVDINLFVNARQDLDTVVPRFRKWPKNRPQNEEDRVMQVQPYLFFDGRAEEAIDFYKKAVGAEVGMLMRWKDSPEKSMCTPSNENKVMHASLTIGNTRVMASDGENKGHPDFKGFALSLDARDEADADRLFNALSSGGKVTLPLTKTFFSPRFGMLADKFGVNWMIIVEPK
jgi:PhnB protein